MRWKKVSFNRKQFCVMCILIGMAFKDEINLWKLLIAKTIDVIDANRNKSVKFYWIQFALKIVIESNWNINFTVLFAFENQIKLFVGLYSCKIEILFTQIELLVFFFGKKSYIWNCIEEERKKSRWEIRVEKKFSCQNKTPWCGITKANTIWLFEFFFVEEDKKSHPKSERKRKFQTKYSENSIISKKKEGEPKKRGYFSKRKCAKRPVRMGIWSLFYVFGVAARATRHTPNENRRQHFCIDCRLFLSNA